MKKTLKALTLCVLLSITVTQASAQWQELQQLALDIEKLAKMKAILQQMYDGYKILTSGYNTVKALATGNFNLHDEFLKGLLSVNPSIKKYARVADIVNAQSSLIKEYKAALQQFNSAGVFTSNELNYFGSVYSHLVDKSLDNLDELVMVVTDGTLRMSDAERITAIDHIYEDMTRKVTFLRQFNGQAAILGQQRINGIKDNQTLKSLYGL